MKQLFFIILLICPLLFVLACKDIKDITVSGGLPERPNFHTPGQVAGHVYGDYFQARNTSLYEDFMEACRRCGLVRNFGGYQRFWALKGDPKRCDSWNKEGFMQIVFEKKTLNPYTQATVSILPKFTGTQGLAPPWSNKDVIELKGTAKAINESEGFQILLNPESGLSNTGFLNILSEHTNHVKDHDLRITVTYGNSNSDSVPIIIQTLRKLNKKFLGKGFYGCRFHYTN